MGLIESNKRIIILLVCTLFVLGYLVPVEAKTNEEIYQEKLDKLTPDDIEGHYQLGLWCLQNKLLDQSKTQFNKVLETNPDHKKARQGMENIIQLEKEAKISEIIKKYGPYKGVLDKAGATKENLPWEKAREKETDHFIVKTNLSVDALNDICVLLECSYFTYQDLFGVEQPQGEKLRVMVAKNKVESRMIHYDLLGYNPPDTAGGYYVPSTDPSNKSRQDHLVSFYDLSARPSLTTTLVHECTHYAIDLMKKKYRCSKLLVWLDEGWATYCEATRLKDEKLVTNVINQQYLPLSKGALTNIKLKDFINLSSKEYTTLLHYTQGWSMVYFLLNGQGGKYKAGLLAYMDAWEKGKIVTVVEVGNYYPQDKPGHLKLFEECMGVPINQLENEWKKYILELK